MKLRKILFRDYKSYKGTHVLTLDKGINTIIGRNGAGKSHLFDVIRLPWHKLKSKDENSRINQDPRIFMVYMTEEEKETILNKCKALFNLDQHRHESTMDGLEFLAELLNLPVYLHGKPDYIISLGAIRISEGSFLTESAPYNMLSGIDSLKDSSAFDQEYIKTLSNFYRSDEWDKFVQKNLKHGETDEDFVMRIYKRLENNSFWLTNLLDLIRGINESIHFFQDVRTRPDLRITNTRNTYSGARTAEILLDLYTSEGLDEREKASRIIEQFSRFFPEHDLLPVKGAKLMVIVRDAEKSDGGPLTLPIESMGMGFMELVIFFVNIFERKNQIFLLEEPENHLHPNHQRMLAEVIRETSAQNQFVVISHSPHFIDIENICSNLIIKREEGSSSIVQVRESQFSRKEIGKIKKIFYHEHPENREMFFARRVILVEGGTEKMGLNYLAYELGNQLSADDVFVAAIGGKGRFPIYHKLLTEFEIDHEIVWDADVTSKIRKKIDNGLTIHEFQPDFEGPLKNKYPQIYQEAEKKGQGKPAKFISVVKSLIDKKGLKAIPTQYIDIVS